MKKTSKREGQDNMDPGWEGQGTHKYGRGQSKTSYTQLGTVVVNEGERERRAEEKTPRAHAL